MMDEIADDDGRGQMKDVTMTDVASDVTMMTDVATDTTATGVATDEDGRT